MRYLLVGLLFVSAFSQATVYKWTDKNGQVHYSDEPKNNAKIVSFEDKTKNDLRLPAPLNIAQKPTQESSIAPQYLLELVSPENEATIRNNNGDITLRVNIKPKLKPSDSFVVFMDGQQLGAPQASPIFELQNIDRGEHQFVIKVLDKNGKQLASTSSIKVFLHRSGLNNRPHKISPFKRPI